MSRVKPAASLLAAALLVASCTGRTGPGATSSASPTGSPSSTGSPSPTGSIELRGDDLGVVSFGEPMRVALRRLVELLGRPTDAQRMHGDLPLGYDGTNAIARWVSFGDLRLLFGDWAEFGEAGAMHLVGWDALGNRTTNGTVLATPEGIRVGSASRTSRPRMGRRFTFRSRTSRDARVRRGTSASTPSPSRSSAA
jgi:hypothetical protein